MDVNVIRSLFKRQRTLSSMTCATRSLASRTRFISSSKRRTLPPTRSAVFAVAETVPDSVVASLYSSFNRGARFCKRVKETTTGCESARSSERDVETSVSSCSRVEREARISGSVVSVRGSGRVVYCCISTAMLAVCLRNHKESISSNDCRGRLWSQNKESHKCNHRRFYAIS
jgi:hypothetical protein